MFMMKLMATATALANFANEATANNANEFVLFGRLGSDDGLGAGDEGDGLGVTEEEGVGITCIGGVPISGSHASSRPSLSTSTPLAGINAHESILSKTPSSSASLGLEPLTKTICSYVTDYPAYVFPVATSR
jgi:hypothetical protein